MVLLVHKLINRPFKFPSKLDDHNLNSAALSAFRSKISHFVAETCSKPETGLDKCFELINIANMAFAKLVVELEYPMSRWGEKLNDEYLGYTLNLLDLINSINSSVSHISRAKIPIIHAVNLIEKSWPNSAAKHLIKVPKRVLTKGLKLGGPITIETRPGCEKEHVVLKALDATKKIGFLALGLVLSRLCGDSKQYMEIKHCVGGFDDSLLKDLDSRFSKEATEIEDDMEEVKEVNSTVERLRAAISSGRYTEALADLKTRLKVVEHSICGIEKKANNLFSETLAARNKLLDNIRLTGENP